MRAAVAERYVQAKLADDKQHYCCHAGLQQGRTMAGGTQLSLAYMCAPIMCHHAVVGPLLLFATRCGMQEAKALFKKYVIRCDTGNYIYKFKYII